MLRDTRDGTGAPKQKLAGGQHITLQVTGAGNVPAAGVAAVALNVTVTDPAASGWVAAYPCGAFPDVSNLNYLAGQTVPNAVIAPVSATGQVCLFSTTTTTHLIADVSGWLATPPPLPQITNA